MYVKLAISLGNTNPQPQFLLYDDIWKVLLGPKYLKPNELVGSVLSIIYLLLNFS